VPEETVRSLCSEQTAERFSHFLRQSFVDERRGAAWCPAPGCTLAVDTTRGGGAFFSCAGGHTFCAGCRMLEAHAPASCDVVKLWQKKCDDDSETFSTRLVACGRCSVDADPPTRYALADWLSLNTQDCPECKSTIEKNGGCNHMTARLAHNQLGRSHAAAPSHSAQCKNCKGEFCWVCLQKWSTHAGDFYNCNKFDPQAAKSKEAAKASTRAALDRYLFHFHRFANHDSSRKLEAATRSKAEAKMRNLQEAAPPRSVGWGDVSFVQSATDEAIACRQVLKWTYVLAYHLADGAPEKELFCFLQQDLEARTERLSGLLERPAEELLQPAVRAEILALQGVAADSRKKLLRGAPAIGITGEAAAGAPGSAAEPPAA
jgi:ariadne-1